MRLTVPSVGLEVTVEAVGVRADGQMEIPDKGDRAGWYRHGPHPGAETGSVVVAAHVDTVTGPGAFLALTGLAADHIDVGDPADVLSLTCGHDALPSDAPPQWRRTRTIHAQVAHRCGT